MSRLPTEDEDFYEEEFSDEYFDEYEGEECDFEDEYEMEDMEDMEDEMDMEDEKVCNRLHAICVYFHSESKRKTIGINIQTMCNRSLFQDDDQRAYQSESDVDEIFLMPEGGKCSDYEYEQYGFENKHFSLEHSMVSRLSIADHDLGVIDEIPYLDEQQPQFAYVTEQTLECDEVLTIYKICSSDDLLTVKEEPIEEEEEAIQAPSQSLSTSEHTEPGCSSVEFALNEYVRNAPSDISVNIESSDLKTDICTVIERADSMELLSGSSGTIRSGSTVTGYDFDTVKNLNLDSCSTSKLSLSLKSEGFDEFTLTPDEQKIIRNCDVEDFTLTPEASCNEMVPVCLSTIDEPESELQQGETLHSEHLGGTPQSEVVASESNAKTDDESISSNEVVMIVDKFLAGERLLQQNLSIIPVDPKTFTSPLVSPIDSDASSTNALIKRHKSSILFNLQSSSSKSTLDDAIDLDKINFDDDCDTNEMKDKEISTFTSEITKEFDLLFSRAEEDAAVLAKTPIDRDDLSDADIKSMLTPTNLQVGPFKDGQTIESDSSSTPKPLTPATARMPTRYSMQKLEPYFFADDVTGSNDHAKTVTNTKDASTIPTVNTALDSKSDYCKVLDTHDGSFLQKKILSKLKKNKSQSLGNLNKKSRCFPL